MSNDKPMTTKKFLKLASGKVSAQAFLNAHRSFLESGELAPIASPILAQLDSKILLPTPALEVISQAVLAHYLATEVAKADAKILAGEERANAAPKPWMVTIFDGKGNIQTRVNDRGETVDLQESFDLASTADNWADRRLFQDCTSDCHAVVEHTSLPIRTIVERQDSIARIMRAKKGPVSKKVGSRDSRLSFPVKAVQSRAHFSHG